MVCEAISPMPRVGVALGGASPCQGFLQSVVGQESFWSDACQSGWVERGPFAGVCAIGAHGLAR